MEKIEFITSFLTFYLKGQILQEKNFIKFKIPNTILGFIPLGASNKTIPINQISSVDTSFKLLFKNFLIGLVVAIIGLSTIGAGIGFIILLLGALIILNSFQTILAVNLTSNEQVLISFIIFEKAKAEQAETGINQLIANKLDDTNTREQTDRIVDAINNNNK